MNENPRPRPRARVIYSVEHGVPHTRYVTEGGTLIRETFGVPPRQFVYRGNFCFGLRGTYCQPREGDRVSDANIPLDLRKSYEIIE